MIRVGEPWILAMALGLVALVALRIPAVPVPGRSRSGWIARGLTLCAALVLAALAGRVELASRRDALAVIAVVDESRSVVEGARDPLDRALVELREASERARADDAFGFVAVGARAALEVVPSPRSLPPATRSDVPRDGSALEAGVRRALAERIDETATRVLLISDGLETEGDLLEAAELARATGVPIDVLPLRRTPSPEIALTSVTVPDTVAPREALDVRVGLSAREPSRARLTIRRDGAVIARGELDLRAGEDVVAVRDAVEAPGLHRYEAELEPLDARDTSPRNNRAEGAMRVEGPPRALAIADDPATLAAFARALEAEGLPVDRRPATAIPLTLGELAGYDLVVLSDVPSRAIPESAQRALASYVRDLGGGLIMAGARRAFGLGGYAGSSLEEALPATFDLRRRRDRLSLGMVIAIDRSGSMSVDAGDGHTKIELANEAAGRSAAMLSASDRIAVAHVDTEVHWTLPMTPVEDPERVVEACRRATSGGGGIYVDVALRAAFDQLRAETTQLKHLLLFSDGSDSEQLAGTEALVREALARRISTSVVSMGRGPDSPALERLASLGDGRFYVVEDLRELPAIFAEETVTASRSALVERAFRPAVELPSPIVRGVDFAAGPPLLGLALVTPRPEASVLLRANPDEALLVVGQRGVGRSAVWTSDLGTELAREFVAWPGASALFAQLARGVARPRTNDGRAALHVDASRATGHVVVDLLDERGRLDTQRRVRATLAGPGGSSRVVDLAQSGVGRYEADVPLDASGVYFVTVVDDRGGVRGSTVVERIPGNELRGDGTDLALLTRVAGLTGGRVLSDARGAFDARLPAVVGHRLLPAWLGALAAALFLLAVAIRRLDRLPGLPARAAEPVVAQAAPIARPSRPAPIRADVAPAETLPSVETPTPPPEAPRSLAEELLARRRRRDR